MATSEGEGEMILLDYWPSMFCMRPKLALAEKGIINYDCREENIEIAKSPLLLDMNPVHKKIPVFIHNGKPVCESLIIVEYIDEMWVRESPLLPSHPYKRSQARFWADFIDNKFYPASKQLWTTKGETKETARKELIESVKLLENELGDKCYFGGDSFGFVDIALLPFYSWFHVYETCGNFSFEKESPNIIAWAKRCQNRDSVIQSLPNMHKVSQLIFDIRKKHGLE